MGDDPHRCFSKTRQVVCANGCLLYEPSALHTLTSLHRTEDSFTQGEPAYGWTLWRTAKLLRSKDAVYRVLEPLMGGWLWRPVPGFPVFLLCAMIGCSTLHKNAETLMEGEAYDEAAKVYTQILDQDPNDARAIVGLKKAQMKWIDKKLIDVRMLRLSEQAVPAAELLKNIIERERKWQFYPEGAVQYTQEEETQHAVRLVAAQTEAWQAKGYLLKARAFLGAYQPIFATPRLLKRYQGLANQFALSANQQCRAYHHDLDPSNPHFATFVKRYCDSWGVSIDLGFDVEAIRAGPLFKDLDVAVKTPSIPVALQARWRDRLRKEFQKTAWYDPKARSVLMVALKAEFAQDHTKAVEHTIHSYTVQVPYTVTIPQVRTYQVPHTTYTTMCTSFGCTQTPFTTYTTQFETVMVPVTRYREDPRQFEYDRWRHHQTLLFHAEAVSVLQGSEVQAIHTEKADDTDTEHPHSVPEAGLQPDPLTLPDPVRWVEEQIDEAAHQWGRSLSKEWIRLHCKAPESAVSASALANYVLRCLREPQTPLPAFADAWYKERFGASQDDVEKWLDRVDQGPVPSSELSALQ